jgi:hypothetical protein
MSRAKWILCAVGLFLGSYVLLYAVNTSLGGYYPYWASDGSKSWSFGMLVHDSIIWQPRIGNYFNTVRHDFVGCAFRPLIALDRRFIHKTHSAGDEDFGQWWSAVPESQIHPSHRAEFRSWKLAEQKRSSPNRRSPKTFVLLIFVLLLALALRRICFESSTSTSTSTSKSTTACADS